MMKNFDFYTEYAQELLKKNNLQFDQENTECLENNNFCDGLVLKKNLSFTPYIYNECSANCKFCSEQLLRGNSLIPYKTIAKDYDQKLISTFEKIKDCNVFLSLSGKEPTLSLDFLERILKISSNYSNITNKVIYSNLSGIANQDNFSRFVEMLINHNVTRVECSRHALDENCNQSIMRFRKNESIIQNEVFEQLINNLKKYVDTRLVCVVQKNGVDSFQKVLEYLDFAAKNNVNSVVFRELCMFDDCVKPNIVSKYIEQNRIDIHDFLLCLNSDFKLLGITKGYYYYSFRFDYKGINVNFEMSDYQEMIIKHSLYEVNKLILYPNALLCRDWNMNLPIYFKEDKQKEYARISTFLSQKFDATLMGSMCLYYTMPEMLEKFPPDADFLVENKKEILLGIIEYFLKEGYKIYSWQDEILDTNFDFDMLKNRFYLRMKKNCFMFDITYESIGYSFEGLKNNRVNVLGINCYDTLAMLKIYSTCNNEKHKIIARKIMETQNVLENCA